jgi:hypothetical protein
VARTSTECTIGLEEAKESRYVEPRVCWLLGLAGRVHRGTHVLWANEIVGNRISSGGEVCGCGKESQSAR